MSLKASVSVLQDAERPRWQSGLEQTGTKPWPRRCHHQHHLYVRGILFFLLPCPMSYVYGDGAEACNTDVKLLVKNLMHSLQLVAPYRQLKHS